jgi:hypothetical protein
VAVQVVGNLAVVGNLPVGPPEAQANALAAAGRFREVVALYDRALTQRPGTHDLLFLSMPVRLYVGDEDGYEAARRQMLARFGGTSDPEVAERTVKVCSLRPGADPAVIRRLVEIARAGAGTYPYLQKWVHLAAGMAAYRAGQFEDADRELAAVSVDVDVDLARAAAEIYLAMSAQRQGRREDAAHYLESATRRTNVLGATPWARPGLPFNEWYLFELSLREARPLLGEPEAGQ